MNDDPNKRPTLVSDGPGAHVLVDPEPDDRDEGDLIVVGIGASAGGLEAFQALIPGLPHLSNMVFVIAQHLDPSHRSLLRELLARNSRLEVVELEHDLELEPNIIFTAPPGADVTFAGSRVVLSKPRHAIGPKPSIDTMFISLANEYGPRGVGVILSGTGSDGAHGVRAIKAEGGLTIAQDPHGAKYDGMPRAAIRTGLIDMVLDPKKIGPSLVDLLASPSGSRTSLDELSLDAMSAIFSALLEQTGCDFSRYKTNTIHRRLARRMAVNKISDLDSYAQFATNSSAELALLFKDILISVTGFFRDPEAYRSLREALRPIVAQKTKGETIRVWVPGCATGEEPYSIAMVLADLVVDRPDVDIQIFATDIDDDAIAIARRGIYPEGLLSDVEPQLLTRYFRHHEDSYQVSKSVREMIVFARHDMTCDPPFSHLDLISCRNLLIYFSGELQREIMPVFHYVLKPHGLLLLGKSESIGDFGDLFRSVDSKWRLYQWRGPSRGPAGRMRVPNSGLPQSRRRRRPNDGPRAKDIMNQAIADAFDSPCALVDARLEIVYVHGDVSAYLTLAPGEAGLNILQLSQKKLRLDLRTLIHKALREQHPVESRPITLSTASGSHCVTLHVRPAYSGPSDASEVIVIFRANASEERRERAALALEGGALDEDPRVEELEFELAALRERLQTTVEELEATSDELQLLNEELQSSNEELQSSNEELETANEELQSTNEELTTVNEELQIKSDELTSTNIDLENIQQRMGLAMIIVDHHLRVKRYTSQARRIFALGPTDYGEVLTHFVNRINLVDLHAKLNRVLVEEQTHEEALSASGVHYLVRIMPYYDNLRRVTGAVLLFFDRTDLVRKSEELRELNRSLESTVEERTAQIRLSERILSGMFSNIHIQIALLSSALELLKVNPAFALAHGKGKSAEELSGTNFVDHEPDEDLLTVIRRTIETGDAIHVLGKPLSHLGSARVWDWTVQLMDAESDTESTILLTLAEATKGA